MRLFLSYSSKDRALAEPIYLALRAQGHRVFFDRSDLPPGEEYDIRIRRAIERSRLFVFLASPDSLKTGSYDRVTGGSHPPPVPTERSVRFSRTTLFRS
jgi:TIR domain